MRQLTEQQLIHRQYLGSELWKNKRREALQHYGCKCSRCGGFGSDVHHKTYDRVGGNELLEDLEVMCRDCHEAHHAAERCSAKVKRWRSPAINQQAAYRLLLPKHKAMLMEEFQVNSDAELYCLIALGKESTPIKVRAARLLGKRVLFAGRRGKEKPRQKWAMMR